MLLRAVRYVGRHRRLAVLAYGSLLVATAAQLMVPQLVRIIIDSFVSGAQGTTGQSAAVQTLLGAMVAIVVFSVVRALFAFGQQYNAERISQNVAFDFRNQLFAKIQRLSFSYLDRNQPLADEHTHLFHIVGGADHQLTGLVMALQSFIL